MRKLKAHLALPTWDSLSASTPTRFSGTPLPPEEPTAENPPDGGIIDYVLSTSAKVSPTLEVFDAQQKPVRHFSR